MSSKLSSSQIDHFKSVLRGVPYASRNDIEETFAGTVVQLVSWLKSESEDVRALARLQLAAAVYAYLRFLRRRAASR